MLLKVVSVTACLACLAAVSIPQAQAAPASPMNRRIIAVLEARMQVVRASSAFEPSVIAPLENAHLRTVGNIRRGQYRQAAAEAVRVADIMIDLIARRQRVANAALPQGAAVGSFLTAMAGERNEITCMYLMNERLRPWYSSERALKDRPFGSCTNASLKELRSRIGRGAVATDRDFASALRIN